MRDSCRIDSRIGDRVSVAWASEDGLSFLVVSEDVFDVDFTAAPAGLLRMGLPRLAWFRFTADEPSDADTNSRLITRMKMRVCTIMGSLGGKKKEIVVGQMYEGAIGGFVIGG
jgi:hypothetical protein